MEHRIHQETIPDSMSTVWPNPNMPGFASSPESWAHSIGYARRKFITNPMFDFFFDEARDRLMRHGAVSYAERNPPHQAMARHRHAIRQKLRFLPYRRPYPMSRPLIQNLATTRSSAAGPARSLHRRKSGRLAATESIRSENERWNSDAAAPHRHPWRAPP